MGEGRKLTASRLELIPNGGREVGWGAGRK